MWSLVFVYFYDAVPYVELVGNFDTMYECFYAREDLSKEVGNGNGYFKGGQQALCINMTEGVNL